MTCIPKATGKKNLNKKKVIRCRTWEEAIKAANENPDATIILDEARYVFEHGA